MNELDLNELARENVEVGKVVVRAVAHIARLRSNQLLMMNPRYRKFRRRILKLIACKLGMRFSEYKGSRYTYEDGRRDLQAWQLTENTPADAGASREDG